MGNETSSPQSSLPPVENNIKLFCKSAGSSGDIPTPREGHCAGVIENHLFVFGGGFNSAETGPVQSNELFICDLATFEWKKPTTSGNVPPSRTGAASAVVGGKFFIFGGLNSEEGWLNDAHVFDPATLSWTTIPSSPSTPSARDKVGCCAVGQKIYVFGGFGPQIVEEEEEEEDEEGGPAATFGWFNDLYSFDTGSHTWEKCVPTGTLPSPRAACGMAALDNEIIIFGGRDNTQRVNDTFKLNLSTMSWQPLTLSGQWPVPRSFHTLTRISSFRFLVFGGLDRGNQHLHDLHILDTVSEANVWVQPSVEETISPRGFCSASLWRTQVILFGGSSEFDGSIHECRVYHNSVVTIDCESIISAPPFEVPIVAENPDPVADLPSAENLPTQ